MNNGKGTALIFGINGQDGSYLAEALLERGYAVHGFVRRSSVNNLWRIQPLLDSGKITLHHGDITDASSVESAVDLVRPTVVANEADQDAVDWSYSSPAYSSAVTYGGVVNVLEAVRKLPGYENVKVFQPVSATMFGNSAPPQSENTPFSPESPYACAKVGAYYLARHYRQTYGMFVSTGILFNHHSPRRKKGYLLDKIAEQCFNVRNDLQAAVKLRDRSNLDFRVDIGHACEFMRGVANLLDLSAPCDVCLSSGMYISLRSLLDTALNYCKLPLNTPTEESGYRRPTVTEPELLGDCQRARSLLDWKPKHNARTVLLEVLKTWSLYSANQ